MGVNAASASDQKAAAWALARSEVYRALAAAFRYPDAAEVDALGRLKGLAGGGAAEHFTQAVVEALFDLEAAAREAAPESLRDQYVATFGHVTLPDCPIHETACGIGDPFQQAQTLADLAGFYRAFGLEVASGAGERVDHLAIELEFMHYLAYREAYAIERHGPPEVAMIREAEGRFLQDHLGRWAPAVARAVAARAGGVLGAAARLLERFVADESERWGISPSQLLVEGAPPAAERGFYEGEEEDFTGREL